MLDLKLKGRYSFSLYGTPGLPTTVKNATLTSILDAADAAAIEDIYTLHAASVSLPSGTPSDVNSFSFYKFRTEAGGTIVVADAWINPNTLTSVSNGVLTLTIPDVTTSDRAIILDALRARGYRVSSTNFTNS